MMRIVALRGAALAALLLVGTAITAEAEQDGSAAMAAQTAPRFQSLGPVAFGTDGPVLRAGAQAQKPLTVAGPRGVLVGQQDGTLEAWVLPVKVLSHLRLEARVAGYAVPIDVNQQAAEVEVRPDRTVVTFAHIGFTVREILFSAPAAGADERGPAVGPVVLFEFDCLHPTEFTFRFTPNLEWMWPERNEGVPGVGWVSPDARVALAAGGFYFFGTDYPDLAAAVTIPGAEPGILAPYQERPKEYPVELKLRIDPKRDNGRLFPLLMAVGMNRADATQRALGEALERLNAGIPALYAAEAEGYKKLLESATRIETPDRALNEAFEWAVISMEQLKTTVPWTARPKELEGKPAETALVAGYYSSADSARPGFGWFFGRDALYTLYAVNGYGDFGLAKDELEFLIHRQRGDGKIMHEFSQTAAAVDWAQFPYQWAAADATPLFLLAMADYVRTSGDVGFLTAQRAAVEKAWAFETDPAHDTDHDGIYDNSQGTGWVESWPGGMPHQEVYLALLDQQASAAYAWLETQLKDEAKAHGARERAKTLAKTINAEYYDAGKSCYAFSRNMDGSLDRTRTVYPAVAWWDPEGGRAVLEHGDECLRQFAASGLNTDWGTRDVAADEAIYDGMSYHQGSVWPLFTGWAALAEYRAGQPLAGYQLLKENALLTRAQDLGAHTELLSGDYFVPMGRSTSHQLWSSAMVVTPALRGLFGLSVDATAKTITVNPRLPGGWDSAEIRNVALPGGSETIHFNRQGDKLLVDITDLHETGWKLRSEMPGAALGQYAKVRKEIRSELPEQLAIPLPALEVDPALPGFAQNVGAPLELPGEAPIPGARTLRFRILQSEYGDHKLTLLCEGLAGTQALVSVIRHGSFIPKVRAEAPEEKAEAILSAKDGWAFQDAKAPLLLVMNFPKGEGFQRMTVTLSW